MQAGAEVPGGDAVTPLRITHSDLAGLDGVQAEAPPDQDHERQGARHEAVAKEPQTPAPDPGALGGQEGPGATQARQQPAASALRALVPPAET